MYYYFKTACIALWAKEAGPLAAIGKLGELQDAIREGLAFDTNYEGGGLHRVVAAIYVRSKGILPIMFNPTYALAQINKAIDKGPQFYNAYFIKAQALDATNQKDKAIDLLEKTIADLEKRVKDNTLPKGYEPETKGELYEMKKFLASLS